MISLQVQQSQVNSTIESLDNRIRKLMTNLDLVSIELQRKMEFSDFGDFKDRITNNYCTNVHAEEEFSKIYSTLYNCASKPQFEQLSSSVYDLKLESLAKLEYREEMKRFREESDNLYSSKSGVEKNMEEFSRAIPLISRDIQIIKEKINHFDDSESKNKTYMNRILQVINGKLDVSYKDEVLK